MLTTMTEADWTIVLRVFEASRSRRGDKGRNDRRFLEALHYFVVHNITWRALPEKFGHWNSVWKRFWRLSRSGTFEAFLREDRMQLWLFRRARTRLHLDQIRPHDLVLGWNFVPLLVIYLTTVVIETAMKPPDIGSIAVA